MCSELKRDKKNKKGLDKKSRRHNKSIMMVCCVCFKFTQCIKFKRKYYCITDKEEPSCLSPHYECKIQLYKDSAFENAVNRRPMKANEIWYHKVVSE